MSFIYDKLTDTELPTLHQTFLEAFSDYAVPIMMSFEEYQKMLKRRGVELTVSVGAFSQKENQLVGLMLNGLRSWQGKRTVYDAMTGVVPNCRKQGITQMMFKEVLQLLETNKVEQYLLEVLQENTAAFELYRKQGFSITRSFSVFDLPIEKTDFTFSAIEVKTVRSFQTEDWKYLCSFWDFTPSWQNSIDSVSAVSDVFDHATVQFDNRIIGYGMIDRHSGDIPQIAVHPDFRRRGIGTAVLSELSKKTAADRLRIINVDDSCEGMKRFLNSVHFNQTTSQYEMMLKL